jgi:uncharacterized membrane protein
MRNINTAIVNPIFLLILFATPVVLLTAVILGAGRRAWVLVSLLLLIGALAITFTVNIPLNEGLERAGTADPETVRAAFERDWNTANIIRTLLATGSLIACAVAPARR